ARPPRPRAGPGRCSPASHEGAGPGPAAGGESRGRRPPEVELRGLRPSPGVGLRADRERASRGPHRQPRGAGAMTATVPPSRAIRIVGTALGLTALLAASLLYLRFHFGMLFSAPYGEFQWPQPQLVLPREGG